MIKLWTYKSTRNAREVGVVVQPNREREGYTIKYHLNIYFVILIGEVIRREGN